MRAHALCTPPQEHDVSEYDEDAFEDLRNGPLGVKVSSHMLEQVLLHYSFSTVVLAELIDNDNFSSRYHCEVATKC
jgi:hypothetical protein